MLKFQFYDVMLKILLLLLNESNRLLTDKTASCYCVS